jgi:hypothetical protein
MKFSIAAIVLAASSFAAAYTVADLPGCSVRDAHAAIRRPRQAIITDSPRYRSSASRRQLRRRPARHQISSANARRVKLPSPRLWPLAWPAHAVPPMPPVCLSPLYNSVFENRVF